MSPRERTSVAPAGSYRVTVTLSVENAEALWSAAAERALAAPGMTLSDVLDTLGPREDPAIADCIAMLAMPIALPGCALEDFGVREALVSGRSSSAEGADVIALPTRPAHMVQAVG